MQPLGSSPAINDLARSCAHFTVLVALLILLALTSGCSIPTRYAVEISALASERGAAGEATYFLLPANGEVDPRDLQFLEFARAVERGLAERGFLSTRNPSEATTVLLLDYGVNAKEIESITPVRPAISYYGDYRGGYGFYGRPRNGPRCGHGCLRGLGFSDPFYLDSQQTRTFATFNRFFAVEARRIEAGRSLRAGEPVWETHVESRGREADLRAVFPALVAAAVDYLGTDTGQAIGTKIRGDDERITRIRAQSVDVAAPPPVED